LWLYWIVSWWYWLWHFSSKSLTIILNKKYKFKERHEFIVSNFKNLFGIFLQGLKLSVCKNQLSSFKTVGGIQGVRLKDKKLRARGFLSSEKIPDNILKFPLVILKVYIWSLCMQKFYTQNLKLREIWG